MRHMPRMRKNHRMPFALVTVLLLLVTAVHPAHALLGIGAHKGVDFSLNMADAADPFEIEGAMLTIGAPPVSILDSAAGYAVSRSGWQRTWMNFGGKFYIDIVPLIDAVELSCNFGVWQYECGYTYPKFNMTTQTLYYETMRLSLDSLGLEPKWGVHEMPYARLHADFTIRKYVVRVPREVKLLNVYAGGGFSMFMSTPVLTGETVREQLTAILRPAGYNMLNPVDTGKVAGRTAAKNAANGIVQGLTERTAGLHFIAGAIFQVPMVPLSLYADAKIMIPFTEISRDAGLGGYGIVLNAGVALSVASERTKNTEGFE